MLSKQVNTYGQANDIWKFLREGNFTVDPATKAQAQADIKFGYCTEFIILLNKTFNIKMEMDFKEYLESIGDSIVCAPAKVIVYISGGDSSVDHIVG